MTFPNPLSPPLLLELPGCGNAFAAALHIRADACMTTMRRLATGSKVLLFTATDRLRRSTASLSASVVGQHAQGCDEHAQRPRRLGLLGHMDRGRNLLRRAPRGAGLSRVSAARRGARLASWSTVRARRREWAWAQSDRGQRWMRIRRWVGRCEQLSIYIYIYIYIYIVSNSSRNVL